MFVSPPTYYARFSCQTCSNNSYQGSTLKLVFFQTSKIPAAGAGCWLETQISTATDTTANLTWIYIFHLAVGCWQISRHLSLWTGVTQRATQKLPRRARDMDTGQIMFSNLITEQLFFKLKMLIYRTQISKKI